MELWEIVGVVGAVVLSLGAIVLRLVYVNKQIDKALERGEQGEHVCFEGEYIGYPSSRGYYAYKIR